MKFKKATIKDFKRFTDLTVQGIPETTRLIMLAGPNGCGKSSFLDALNIWHNRAIRYISWQQDYHHKIGSSDLDQYNSGGMDQLYNHHVEIEFYEPETDSEKKKRFYFRSSYRNDPELQIQEIRRAGNPFDKGQVKRMIDNDAAVNRNYHKLASQGCEDLYSLGDESKTFGSYRRESIEKLQQPLSKLFPDLELEGLGNPLEDGTFRFTKGTSAGFAFINLSGGEKAVFDLILDLVVASRDYDNTVFCIDEPESHMNARLQAELLSVLYELIPDKCQLMLATHSIGMMRRARDIEASHPGTVVFLDFSFRPDGTQRDFDKHEVILPAMPDRTFWKRHHDVALDDLSELIAPRQIVLCEGAAHAGSEAIDASCYNKIFSVEFPDTLFISVGSNKDVEKRIAGLISLHEQTLKNTEIIRLRDRDELGEKATARRNSRGIRVLLQRNLESILLCDEILKKLCRKYESPEKDGCLIKTRDDQLKKIKAVANNDFKPAVQAVQHAAYQELPNLERSGDKEDFMLDILVPLITSETQTYIQLKQDLFGP